MTTPTKLHIITTSEPLALLRAVRFLAQAGIACEIGGNFVKFPRGEETADQLAHQLKDIGFKPIASMDRFSPDTAENLHERVAPLLTHHDHGHAHDHGHVHGPGCGHDHHHS
ncbi:MAG: hypothetical protein RLZZ290_894 [Pseudomonadota bacterium]|jgi:urease accessory protein